MCIRDSCSHFHADQFACIIERRWTYDNEMFRRSCARINALSQTQNVVIKWGVYQVEDRDIPVEQMCDRALLAAHSVKGQYQNYFACYDDVLRRRLLLEQEIVDGMEQALADGQFEIYLQPKYSIADSSLSGAEALVRWNHPRWGLQSPAVFIPGSYTHLRHPVRCGKQTAAGRGHHLGHRRGKTDDGGPAPPRGTRRPDRALQPR